MYHKMALMLFVGINGPDNLITFTVFTVNIDIPYSLLYISKNLTLVLLNPDIPCICKQCRSRSVGF